MKTKELTILTMVIWGFVLVISAIIFVSLFIGRGMSFKSNSFFGIGTIHSNRSEFVVVKEEEFYYMNSLNLEWIEGNVSIFPTNDYAIKVVQKANKNINKNQLFNSNKFYSMPNQEHEDNSLTITDGRIEQKRAYFFNFNWGRKNNYASDIEIYLPQRVYKQIAIESVSSDVDLTDTSASKFSVESVSGNASGSVTANNIDFTTVSGNANLDVGRTLNGNIKVTTESVSGDIDMSFDMLPMDIDTNSISGDVDITLPESNFTAELESVSGEIKLDNVTNNRGGKREITAGEGASQIKLETVSGNLSIAVK